MITVSIVVGIRVLLCVLKSKKKKHTNDQSCLN